MSHGKKVLMAQVQDNLTSSFGRESTTTTENFLPCVCASHSTRFISEELQITVKHSFQTSCITNFAQNTQYPNTYKQYWQEGLRLSSIVYVSGYTEKSI